jgi:PPOX class probable F420-dependent enzyme
MDRRTILTEEEKAFIHGQRVARLATADENGHATLVPVCYALDDTVFYTPLDEKPKRVAGTKLRRVHNIEARHEATLLIDQYSDDWSQLGYIQVSSHAELLYPEDTRHAQALVLLRQRYVQYRSMGLENYPVILLTPQHIVAWGPIFTARER